MRRIRSSRPDVSWLQGPGPCDLWTWVDERGAIKEQELTFFGRTVVSKGGKLATGLCRDDGAGVLGKTGLLDFDTNLDVEAVLAAYKILVAIPEAARTPAVAELSSTIAAELSARGLALPAAPAAPEA